MKKNSIRIISLILVIFSLIGTLSVVGFAKECEPETHSLTYHHIDTTISNQIIDVTSQIRKTNKDVGQDSLIIDLPNGETSNIKFYSQRPSPTNRHIREDVPAPKGCDNWQYIYIYTNATYTENRVKIKAFYCAGCASDNCNNIKSSSYTVTVPDAEFHMTPMDTNENISYFNGWSHCDNGYSYYFGDIYNEEIVQTELLPGHNHNCETYTVYHGIYEKDDMHGNAMYLVGILSSDEYKTINNNEINGCYNYNIVYNDEYGYYDVYCNGHDVCIGHNAESTTEIIVNYCNDVPYCSHNQFSFIDFILNILRFIFPFWFHLFP